MVRLRVLRNCDKSIEHMVGGGGNNPVEPLSPPPCSHLHCLGKLPISIHLLSSSSSRPSSRRQHERVTSHSCVLQTDQVSPNRPLCFPSERRGTAASPAGLRGPVFSHAACRVQFKLRLHRARLPLARQFFGAQDQNEEGCAQNPE